MVRRNIVSNAPGAMHNNTVAIPEGTDSLVTFLNEHPKLNIEIGVHTDTKESDSFNKEFSQKQAKYIFDYLIIKGIAANRLSPVGYGESMPLVPCPSKAECGEDVNSKNRRVEFKILSVD